MKRFAEAREAFGKVLKVDKKQSKVVGEYLKDVEREERLHAEETKVQELMSTQVRMVSAPPPPFKGDQIFWD